MLVSRKMAPEASYNHHSSGHVEEDGKLWLVVAEVQRTNTRVIARESSPGAVELGFRGTVSEDSGGASQARFRLWIDFCQRKPNLLLKK